MLASGAVIGGFPELRTLLSALLARAENGTQKMVSYQPGRESGLWFEIKCLTEDIASKSKRGIPCNHKKETLKALLKKKRMEESQKPSARRDTSKSDSV